MVATMSMVHVVKVEQVVNVEQVMVVLVLVLEVLVVLVGKGRPQKNLLFRSKKSIFCLFLCIF